MRAASPVDQELHLLSKRVRVATVKCNHACFPVEFWKAQSMPLVLQEAMPILIFAIQHKVVVVAGLQKVLSLLCLCIVGWKRLVESYHLKTFEGHVGFVERPNKVEGLVCGEDPVLRPRWLCFGP